MPDRVYPPVIAACKLMFRVLDLRIAREGTEHVPTTGGAVLAANHVSYLDFIFAGFGALPARRLVRFMAKHEVFEHRVSGPLMRGMHHIPVDRQAGQASYQQALSALRAGEVVGIFPEATISRSFTVKEVKSGAVRLAAEAGVPLLPTALWGTQRLWTKGRPKSLTQRHVPVTIVVGEPIEPTTDDALRKRMQELLDEAQQRYPESGEGQWWQPAHLGGTAPTPEEAARLDARR
ncbi:lysophospholipid acyltransferase family protein [Saccharothrix syringae]|uniref:1-acyl-sn-glycerol-3-phosphate acyltransferase n=1 Tax=Saccharothrix syringae TaxID=103733 RepID=A0A5Q0H981_SACSY|nr:lysophospholipid acyltransferase family protein [Saccharothrix syringae]QFZ22787.1 1-acyl-sn-glycerol-3-phosphate acyltransferase [Saccharothrix syringae]